MTGIARQDHQASVVHQEAVVPSPSGTGLEGVRTAVDVCVNLSDVLCLMAWSGGNARKLAGETASASTAVAQIAATISDIADLGAGAEEQAAQARSLVVSGAAQVEASGAAMSAIAGAFGELDSRLGELRRSSDSIGSFADAIQRVANQTKLLALNATIEAARAGTAGRGFAVVAAEVKALSEEASHTAALIRGQLDALGGVTAAMTEAMSTGAARVREGRATAQAVASDMDKITARVADTAVGIGRIAAMLGERRVAMNDLVRGLGEINRLAEQSQTDTAAATDVLMRTEAIMDQFMTREAEMAGPDAASCRLKADHMVWKRELAECLAGVRGTDARGRSRLNEPFGAGFGRIATAAGAGSGAHSRLASLARPLAQAASDMMRHLAGGEMDAAVSDYMTMDGLSQDALTAMTTLADGVGRLPAH